jgi:hypothetical protein
MGGEERTRCCCGGSRTGCRGLDGSGRMGLEMGEACWEGEVGRRRRGVGDGGLFTLYGRQKSSMNIPRWSEII